MAAAPSGVAAQHSTYLPPVDLDGITMTRDRWRQLAGLTAPEVIAAVVRVRADGPGALGPTYADFFPER